MRRDAGKGRPAKRPPPICISGVGCLIFVAISFAFNQVGWRETFTTKLHHYLVAHVVRHMAFDNRCALNWCFPRAAT